jgi:acyl-CoA thioesterase
MALKQTDSTVKLEDRILLAVKAYQNGQFRSIRAAAAAYDVPHSTLAHQIKGRKVRTNIPANCQKLSSLEEASLKKWILDIDERGLPPTHAAVRKMADLLLYKRKGEAVSERWITRFIK